ncbi:TIM-barrel domain-containing protein [Sphingomonas daechungensis]|uniref:TIM-barrel domain-containing protein n=1 Tax=Sphingomonas daechungensis TaxID=1176646 RepID=UPI0037DA46C5
MHVAAAANQGYAPYDSGIAGDHFLKNADRSLYVAPVWPGPSVFPDFTRKSSRDWWGNLYKPFVADGIAGFWNDMNEPAIFETPTKTMPLSTTHRVDSDDFATRTATHAELHNVYGMENSRATYDGLLKLRPNVRPFVMTRATFAGGQKFAVTWTGDNNSTWDHLKLAVQQMLNLGLSGISWSGADIPGFIGGASPELATRWYEIAAFTPVFRGHAANNAPGPSRGLTVRITSPSAAASSRSAIACSLTSTRSPSRTRALATRSCGRPSTIIRSSRNRPAIRPWPSRWGATSWSHPRPNRNRRIPTMPACPPRMVRLLVRPPGLRRAQGRYAVRSRPRNAKARPAARLCSARGDHREAVADPEHLRNASRPARDSRLSGARLQR